MKYNYQNNNPRRGKMKRNFFLTVFILLIIGLMITGCSSSGKPSSVVKKFYTAIEKGDTAAFNELMTPDSAQMMIMFAEKAKGMLDEKADSGSITNAISKMEETINGDTATVKTIFKDGSTENLDLVKVDGKWKISMNFNK
jgi:ketosteroid isomerase-like protein